MAACVSGHSTCEPHNHMQKVAMHGAHLERFYIRGANMNSLYKHVACI